MLFYIMRLVLYLYMLTTNQLAITLLGITEISYLQLFPEI